MVGDVVEVPFPFTDLSSSKKRPAVVLADVGMNDWVLCELTSSRRSLPGDVPVTNNDMQSGRLDRNSWARVSRLHTLSARLFVRHFGRLTDAKQSEIAAAVRSLF